MPTFPFSSTDKYILWVGNSFFYYNNGINHHLKELVRAGTPSSTYRGTTVTISGAGLDWHDVDSYFRPNAIGRYAFNDDNTISFKPGHQHFDALVMMDSSQGPIHPELQSSFHRSAEAHCNTARRNGTLPILFMSWAYSDRPEMTEQISEQYSIAAKNCGAILIPTGLAFASVTARSNVILHQPGPESSHAGRHLSCCLHIIHIYFRTFACGNVLYSGP